MRLLLFVILLVANIYTVKAQETSRYNNNLHITEYYNSEGKMTGFSRINKALQSRDYYTAEGEYTHRVQLKKEEKDELEEKKNGFPKKQLTEIDLTNVKYSQYETVNGKRLIREAEPNLEIIGYYNKRGKLVGYKKYNRGIEEWEYVDLEENKTIPLK